MGRLWCFLLLGLSVLTTHVHGQPSTQGFMSIDCGIADDKGYNDLTNIWYTSDGQYIDSGNNSNIAASCQSSSLPRQDLTVRSFPVGERNCYTLKPVNQGKKYLLRATFMYGNYDGLQSVQAKKQLLFDLYIGANYWKRVNISDASAEYSFEGVNVALADFIWVCLINIGSGTPFISALELRPLTDTIYPFAVANQSNAFIYHINYGPTTNHKVRYLDDPYDRIWTPYPYDPAVWTPLSTTSPITLSSDERFTAPVPVLQTAATPTNSTNFAFLQWQAESNTPTPPAYFDVLHFSELVRLAANASRQFNLYVNGVDEYDYYMPSYLEAGFMYSRRHETVRDSYQYMLNASSNSTLAPIINAAQIYSIIDLPNAMTELDEVT